MHATIRRFSALILVLLFAGCTGPGDVTAERDDSIDIVALAEAIKSLNPDVDPDEAERAARIAYEYTQELAISYEIEDPPLRHNIRVNNGEKPRGLCWHWAEDMQQRLAREGFETLDLHRAIANAFNPILIDHSTVIISGPGDEMEQGIVIDPWRYGGVLFWAPLVKDSRYNWINREIVFERKRERLRKEQGLEAPIDPSTERLPSP